MSFWRTGWRQVRLLPPLLPPLGPAAACSMGAWAGTCLPWALLPWLAWPSPDILQRACQQARAVRRTIGPTPWPAP